jgi:hypothetical protein
MDLQSTFFEIGLCVLLKSNMSLEKDAEEDGISKFGQVTHFLLTDNNNPCVYFIVPQLGIWVVSTLGFHE